MTRRVPPAILDQLAALPLFAGCNRRELEALSRIGTHISVEPGHVLTRQGRLGHEFFVVVQGEAHCAIDGNDVGRYGPGDFFGEMSLLDHQVRSATVTADSPMELLTIDAREFGAMLHEAPTSARRILQTLSERVRAAQAAATTAAEA